MNDQAQDLIRRLADALEGWKPTGDSDLLLIAEARAYLREKSGMMRKAERPDRLIAGDVWEFETDVPVKGKRKPQTVKLRCEVTGYPQGGSVRRLKSLDGKHYIYLWECAPQYEEMEYIGTLSTEQ